MHDLSLILNLTSALAVALACGWVTQRLGLSTLVGYMVAGILVGPHTPGFVADARIAQQMAEIGVILLMFGVGMHFHPQDLFKVRRVAVPGAVVQSAVAAVAGWALARWLGWSHAAGIVFGMALAVASTVVLLRMLVQQDRIASHDGHVAVGWLIVEDLFTVVALVLLPALASTSRAGTAVGVDVAIALGKAALFAVLIWALGTRLVAPVMERIARTRSRELFTLTVFVVALGIAILAAEVFHMSVALGAFFAGLVVGQSRIGPQAAADMTPFRDVFSALFFVSIGMLFEPALLISQPLLLAASLAIVLVLKPLAALAIVLLLRDSARTALTVAVGLAQIGEFSFILAALGVSLGVLEPQARDALVAVAIVSIALNPLLFRLLPRLEARFASASAPAPAGVPADPGIAPPVVVAGLGDLGSRVAARCEREGIAVRSMDTPDSATLRGARAIVVTVPSLARKMQVCTAARALNPRIAIIASADSVAERAWLQEFGAAFVSDALDEVSESLVRAVRAAL